MLKKYLLIVSASAFFLSCKKAWLEEKPDISLAVPTTLKDFRSLLDGTTRGGEFNIDYGTLVEVGAADFYVTDANYDNASLIDRSFYSWDKDLWKDPNYSSWVIPYKKILYTNVVLEGVEEIVPENSLEQRDWNEIKGTALFFRAAWHYDIAKQFCGTYIKATANSDLGIPLKKTSDFNEPVTRATIEETYSMILADLKLAAELLPVDAPGVADILYKCRPTKTAAYAMLARVYLSMNDFENAEMYASSALHRYSFLINYSTRSTTSSSPFPRFYEEVIFHMVGQQYLILLNGSGIPIVDSTLYNSYSSDDLRKALFFRALTATTYTFKNGYAGSSNLVFNGLATDELYMIRAECHARKGNLSEALSDLNTLLKTRWKNNGTWVDIVASTPQEALSIIISERRKELCFRAIRWTDLKRYNIDPNFQITLHKNVKGNAITLPPNSPLYIFSIPPIVVELSGIQQNPR